MEMMIGGVSHGKRCGSIRHVSVHFVHVISSFVVFPGKWRYCIYPWNDILRFLQPHCFTPYIIRWVLFPLWFVGHVMIRSVAVDVPWINSTGFWIRTKSRCEAMTPWRQLIGGRVYLPALWSKYMANRFIKQGLYKTNTMVTVPATFYLGVPKYILTYTNESFMYR